MGIAQIIILSVLGLLFVITSLRLISFTIDNMPQAEVAKSTMSIVALLGIFMIIMTLLISMVMTVNEQREELRDKCPELEKLDNVYKIK